MLRRASLILLLISPGFAQQQPTLTFEVASIKPTDPDTQVQFIQFMPGGGLKMTGVALRGMITFAYDVLDFQVSGGLGWIGTERFDLILELIRTIGSSVDPFDHERIIGDSELCAVEKDCLPDYKSRLARREFHIVDLVSELQNLGEGAFLRFRYRFYLLVDHRILKLSVGCNRTGIGCMSQDRNLRVAEYFHRVSASDEAC